MKKISESVKKLGEKIRPKKGKDNPGKGKTAATAKPPSKEKPTVTEKVKGAIKKNDQGKKEKSDTQTAQDTEVDGLVGQEALSAEGMRKRKTTEQEE